MDEVIKQLPSLGVGGILAAFIFVVHHNSNKANFARTIEREKILVDLIEKNITTMTTLVELIRRMK